MSERPEKLDALLKRHNDHANGRSSKVNSIRICRRPGISSMEKGYRKFLYYREFIIDHADHKAFRRSAGRSIKVLRKLLKLHGRYI